MLIFVLVSNNPLRLAMLTAGFQCLKYCSFKNELKVLLLLMGVLTIYAKHSDRGLVHKHIYIHIYNYKI